ncbi:MAG: hypothetical protein Q8J78_15660 [Moraxellaceae bacterium]|nr:hypothetical protein [Moraxellaceae bacterium]
MDIANELFGTFSGQLVLLIGVIMIIGMPLTIWWALGHVRESECEKKDHKAHPDA